RFRADVRVKQAGFQQVEHRLETIGVAKTDDQFDEVAEVPSWLAAVTDAGEDLTAGRLQLLEAAINDGGVGDGRQDALDQLRDRPLVARFDEAARHLAEKGLVEAREGAPQPVGPRI